MSDTKTTLKTELEKYEQVSFELKNKMKKLNKDLEDLKGICHA